MSGNFTVVSYYTPEYEDHAMRLQESLHRFGLQYYLAVKPSSGSWQANCAFKPRFILHCREKFPGMPLLWLDADATVEATPKLIANYADMPLIDVAVRTSNTTPPHPWNRVMSGTVYLGPGERTTHLVRRWAALAEMNPRRWDQVSLAFAIEEASKDGTPYNLEPLPEPYCAVHDRRQSESPAVIMHWQASRKLKSVVGDAGDSE